MSNQKRRVIYMSDEEWALLTAHAKEHEKTISGVIRDMWALAAKLEPADPAERARVTAAATSSLGRDPYAAVEFRPVPKPAKRK